MAGWGPGGGRGGGGGGGELMYSTDLNWCCGLAMINTESRGRLQIGG